MMVTQSTESTGWFVLLDVWGFSAMVRESRRPLMLLTTLAEAHVAFSKHLRDAGHACVRFALSDTLMLFYSVQQVQQKYNVLQEAYSDVAAAVGAFAERDLPLRGALSFGSVAWNQETPVGDPVIRAHELEEQIPAPLVAIPARECTSGENADKIDTSLKRFEHVTLKDGGIVLAHIVLPHQLEQFAALVSRKYKRHVLRGPPRIAKAWYELQCVVERRIAEGKRKSVE